jgi:hypothetical protein
VSAATKKGGLNLARVIMLLALVGSLALGWFGWARQRQVAEMERSLGSRVKTLARDVERLAQQHTTLSREANRFGLQAQDDPETYIRKIAAAQFVEIGDVELTPRVVQTSVRGVEDRTWAIRPNPPRAFQRSQIANLLYKLEADSRRVVVTDIQIDQADKRLKPHEVPEDRWMFEATLTSRQPADG